MNLALSRSFGAALSVLLALAHPFSTTTASAEDPPAEELRHGARSKAQDGTLVVYDKVTGVFMVPTTPNTFWINKRFYRYDNGVWTAATALAGPWDLVAGHIVPDVARERFLAPKLAVTAKLPSGTEAVFEPRLKIYRVAGKRGVFLFEGMFYRYDNGVWLESSKEDGPWKPASSSDVSAPLRNAVPAPDDGQKVTLPAGDVVVYDRDREFFRLEGKPETIYFDGRFYERQGKKWFSSQQATSGFTEVVAAGQVPSPVRHKQGGDDKDKKGADKNDGGKKNGDKKKAADKKNGAGRNKDVGEMDGATRKSLGKHNKIAERLPGDKKSKAEE